MALSLSLQEALGIAEADRRVLTNAEVNGFIAQYGVAEMDGRAGLLMDLKETHGKHFGRAVSELAKGGLDSRFSVLTRVKDEPQRFRFAAEVLAVGSVALKKHAGVSAEEAKAIDEELAAAAPGLRDRRNGDDLHAAVHDLAVHYYAQKGEAKASVSQALEMLGLPASKARGAERGRPATRGLQPAVYRVEGENGKGESLLNPTVNLDRLKADGVEDDLIRSSKEIKEGSAPTVGKTGDASGLPLESGDDQIAMGAVQGALRARAAQIGLAIRRLFRGKREEEPPTVPTDAIVEIAIERFRRSGQRKIELEISDLGEDVAPDDAILGFVEAALSNRILPNAEFEAQLNLPEVGSASAKQIEEKTGLDVEGYRRAIDVGHIRHAFSRHGIREADPKNEPISPEAVSVYLNVVESPDKITLRKRSGQGPRLTSEKRINGYVVVVEEARTKSKTLAFVTMWIRTAK